MIGVRELEPADAPAVFALARAMHAEAPNYREYPFEDECFWQWFNLFLDNDDWLCLVAADEEHGVIGMLAVGCVNMIFSTHKTVDDLVFFVSPEWRGTTAAVRLLRTLEPWAKARGAREIRLGVTTGTNQAQVVRFLDRFGYRATGVVTTKPL